MMRNNKTLLTAVLSACLSFAAFAQRPSDTLVPLQQNALLRESSRPSVRKSGSEVRHLTLPFFDDFSDSGPYPAEDVWMDRQVFVNNSFPLFPPTYGVATFDALDENGEIYAHARSGSSFWADTLTALPLRLDSIFNDGKASALTAADSVYLSFHYQPGGGYGDIHANTRRGNAPAKSDVLALEFYNAVDSIWTIVWSSSGMNLSDFCPYLDSLQYPVQQQQYFRQVMIPITEEAYLNKDFQFRFRGKSTIDANAKSTGGQWHIDYVYVNASRSTADWSVPDVAFVNLPSSLLKDYSQVPCRHFQKEMLRPQVDFTITNLSSQSLNCRYRYEISDEDGNVVYNGPVSGELSAEVYPFLSDGYRADRAFSSVPASYDFPGTAEGEEMRYEVRHIVSSGIRAEYSYQNDTLVFPQIFGREFAYDDGSAEAGWGLNYADGAVAYAFELSCPDTLAAVRIFFNRTYGDENHVAFNLMVWAADVDNDSIPGQQLYKREGLYVEQQAGLNRFTDYVPDTILILPAGKIFIGIEQLSSTFLNIGFDQNSELEGKFLYSYYNAFTHSWSWETSLYKGALMIRPVFGLPQEPGPVRTLRENPSSENMRVYPNPVRDRAFRLRLPSCCEGSAAGCEVRLFDMRGREIWRRPYAESFSADVAAGVYILKVFAGGKQAGFSKIVVL